MLQLFQSDSNGPSRPYTGSAFGHLTLAIEARAAIAKVRRPKADPLYGRDGPLLSLWKS